jgi:hypothetical protein
MRTTIADDSLRLVLTHAIPEVPDASRPNLSVVNPRFRKHEIVESVA